MIAYLVNGWWLRLFRLLMLLAYLTINGLGWRRHPR